MKIKTIVGLVLTSLIIISCDDTTDSLGSSLTNNMDHLQISTDTFLVSTRSIVADSVLARNSIGYVGKVRDPETGSYVTGDFMTQFHIISDSIFPPKSKIASLENGEIVADSCNICLFYDDFYGDSLNAMKLTAYELGTPVEEGKNYYSNFDPSSNIRANGIKVNKTYTLTNLNDSKSTREDDQYTPNIRIILNNKYTDKNGITYKNYGTYIMRMYFEHPEYFKTSYKMTKYVLPGFYFKNTNGLGSMAYIDISQMNIYYRYKTKISSTTTTDGVETTVEKDTIYSLAAKLSGTEEVLQTSKISYDENSIKQLASDNTCTYLKTPAGIFTEMTIPVDNIMKGHENDTINTAKVVLTRINNATKSDYALDIPQTVLMIQKDSLYSFFEKNKVANYKTSFLASYNSSNNTYTFNNIGGIVKEMYRVKQQGNVSDDWNKVVILPVSTTYTTTSSSTSVLTRVENNLSMSSTKLVGGSSNSKSPIKISVIYSKFE